MDSLQEAHIFTDHCTCTETRMVNEPKTSCKEFMGTKGRRNTLCNSTTPHRVLAVETNIKSIFLLIVKCNNTNSQHLANVTIIPRYSITINCRNKKRLCRCCNCSTEMSCCSLRHCVSEIDQRNKEGRYETWTGCVTPFCVPELPVVALV